VTQHVTLRKVDESCLKGQITKIGSDGDDRSVTASKTLNFARTRTPQFRSKGRREKAQGRYSLDEEGNITVTDLDGSYKSIEKGSSRKREEGRGLLLKSRKEPGKKRALYTLIVERKVNAIDEKEGVGS